LEISANKFYHGPAAMSGRRTADALTIARTFDGKTPSLVLLDEPSKDFTEDRGADGRRDPDHEKGRRQHRGLRAKPAFRQLISDRAYIIEPAASASAVP